MRFLLPSSEPADRGATERQIEEVKKLVAEVEELKASLVARANGALYKLKGAAKKNGTGESET